MASRIRYYCTLARLYVLHFRNALLAFQLRRYRAESAAIAKLLDERPRLQRHGRG